MIDIRQGDALAVLRTLPSDSVHCAVTSPPYWGLRDYGVEGQIGLERCLADHICALVAVFREVRRVLRSDGTVWLNYGDAYASTPNGRSAADTKAIGNDDRTFRDKPISTVGPILVQRDGDEVRGATGKEGYRPGHSARVAAGGVLKPKDRMLLPARVAIALQEDGWWIRDEIVWHKPNPMPSSVRDRTTPAHEMIYLLSKNPRYYYNHEAIKEPCTESTRSRLAQDVASQVGSTRANAGAKTNGNMKAVGGMDRRNRRSVWTVAPKGFKEAHFATFPPALIEPCILAGCPVGGVVLDPFFGAGTTALVAQQLGRDCIGIELNPEYIDIAQRRLGLSPVSGIETLRGKNERSGDRKKAGFNARWDARERELRDQDA